MSRKEAGRLGEALYQQSIRARVEMPENIGKMLIIDVETGDYEIDEPGLKAAQHLYAKHADAALYGIRIGYDVAETLGG